MWQPTTAYLVVKNSFTDGGFTTVTATPNNYVFENTSTDPTKMYFEYKVTLDETKFVNKVSVKLCQQTMQMQAFYRYNNIIFTSFAQIFNHYADVTDIFGKRVNAAAMQAELKAILEKPAGTDRETALKNFRETYDIEVFG